MLPSLQAAARSKAAPVAAASSFEDETRVKSPRAVGKVEPAPAAESPKPSVAVVAGAQPRWW